MDKKSFKGYLYLLPSIIIMICFTLYPLVRAIIMSFLGNYSIINDGYTSIGFENYQALFSDPDFGKSLMNTAIYVICVVPASIILSLLFAVLINSCKKLKALFQTIYFLPYVTSVIAIGIVWRWMFNSNYGLINYVLSIFGIEPIQWLNLPEYAMPALIIFAIWKSMAFNILIFLAGLQTIPEDLYRAARIDSTPRFRVFTRITVPSLAPMIVYSSVIGMIGAFKVYNEVFSLFQGKAGPANSAMTIVYYIYDKFYNSYKYGVAAAGSVVLFLIILALTQIQLRVTGGRKGKN
ncbi:MULTISPECIES: carbohydrate ABC transporter permease [unclassified Butyrivibrio]|jgi:multiple sugar transport system permease protein|uniref:carbohydrate ABC transporter permease n=1 Tax=unclassified Butyrivibrio TaxID=2639466 RepID=UPI00089F4569|nr:MULTISPECIES: sugar ABC transporter permease [unclassified Butyrivibrio]MBE5836924.1 sugar ABC transporter permease [Butyrivibrio sp.]MBQ6414918.1 sugar ABC transporter permease [Butyrivibrio sp.]MBQ9305458.1 sugar ABC transporter permease [Butyrivibrio sp.]SEF96576.1 multiple sugar transport system permease protein [Butyrivibrio sp. Su6]